MDDIRIIVTNTSGTIDITQLVQSVTWSGAYNQCCRTLSFGVLVSSVDKRLPSVSVELGNLVQLYQAGQLRFYGNVLSRDRDAGGDVTELTCIDRGFYLKRNEASYKFSNLTPEAITRKVCSDFGIPVGSLAQTGVRVSRNFPGVSLYQIIATAYTLASLATGKKYMVRFNGPALDVVEKSTNASTLVLDPSSNLITASVSESVENMVNRVAIIDENDNIVTNRDDANAISLYGLMQSMIKQKKDKDSDAEAKDILAENGLEQKITVTNLGNPSLIAGNCVVLRDPVTGLYGLFWIDSDTHTWKNGLYQNKLVLNFRNLMDKTEAGSLPSA